VIYGKWRFWYAHFGRQATLAGVIRIFMQPMEGAAEDE